ncbi:N-acetyltransferase [Acetivibrio mesophilus]|uniref:N-acetyltransferase n=1 Tax=Acetivibrio mesophilus TaxID=2487273 RepID=A0A4Q0IC04_9FIRM|nr:N-acetyltransferase [Acetivibrio mesophilus]ODM26293.1 acetyltransferase [Clostridium sp. Bc-iso-3]RXE60652.1 N-acetyltransferase [Acetivibrio mesophilus]HHV28063.1 N-acetyltransferase [Clostridium sp.]
MIRGFKDTDLNSVMRLWLETNISAHGFIDENYWKSNYDKVKQMMPKATIFVYEEKSIKGFVGLSGNYIAGIFVETNSQSKGIGKILLDYIKEKNKELFLQVYKKNERAVSFYLREGFIIENEQIDINTNETELVMRWENDAK